jgi:hypothetical protein
VAPNYPHKLTKTAEPWLGGGAASGGSELRARVTSAAVRSCHCMFSRGSRRAAFRGRRARRFLQLRVSTLARPTPSLRITKTNEVSATRRNCVQRCSGQECLLVDPAFNIQQYTEDLQRSTRAYRRAGSFLGCSVISERSHKQPLTAQFAANLLPLPS